MFRREFRRVCHCYDIEDQVIIALSELLRSSSSHRDIVSRFGGEEFCIVRKEINRPNAINILERIRKDVEKYSYHIKKDGYVKFTISIGATMYSDATLKDTINEADMMLYKAKNSGKNQVVFEN